jgi:hypothetical protein
MRTIIGLFTLAALLLGACSKKFIDIDPVSTVSVDQVYKTDNDFQNATNGVYAVFQTEYANFWQYGDVRGDDTKSGLVSNLPVSDMDKFILNNDADILIQTWRNYYKAIYRANIVLDRIGKLTTATVANKDRYTGEAKFLRALAYFNLVRIFGDVPLVTTPLTVEETYKVPREKVNTIYDKLIVADLQDAETKLPKSYTGADIGRATMGAAKSLLGKVYLTRHDFPKAEAKLQEVTTLGYSLLPNYKDLFDYTRNEHHGEYVFDIEYEEGINEGSIFTTQFSLSFQGAGTLANVMATAYGLPAAGGGDQGCPTDFLFNNYDTNDTRKAVSVAKGLTVNGVYTPISPTGIGSFTLKYLTPMAKANDSRANWKVIRYADVLLMYAEALNENGKTTDALTYLNMVRTRAHVPTYSGLTQDDTREKIYLERRFEFYLEGQRWFDLVRTGRALSTMSSFGMKDYMTIFPIPQAQIEIINDPAILPQNPGYN